MTEEGFKRAMGFLGLCTRAGQAGFGQEGCVQAVRSHTAQLVLLDEGCSANTRKRVTDACETHGVPLFELPEDAIDGAAGKRGVKVAFLPKGTMGQKLLSLLEDERSQAELGLAGDMVAKP